MLQSAARPKAWVCSRSFAENVSLNPADAWMFLSCECCVLSSRGLCVGLITRPEESYRVWRVLNNQHEHKPLHLSGSCLGLRNSGYIPTPFLVGLMVDEGGSGLGNYRVLRFPLPEFHSTNSLYSLLHRRHCIALSTESALKKAV